MSPKSRRSSRGTAVGLAVAALALAAGCRSAAPLLGGNERPANGTISGTVRGPDGVAPAAGRVVEAVEVDSGDTYSAITSETGFYAIELPPGRYRLDVELVPGEEATELPDVVDVGGGELVTEQDVVLGGAWLVQ